MTEPDWRARVDYDALVTYIQSLDALVDEARVHVDADGIEAAAHDPANVAQVKATLDAAAFDEYATDDELAIGLNISRLVQILDRLDHADTVALAYRDDRRKLTLRAGDYEFTAACIDPDSIRQDAMFPDLDLAAEIDINSDRLRRAVALMDEFSDNLAMGYEPADAEFYVRAEGKTDDGEFRVHRRELTFVAASGEAHSLFSTDYCVSITESLPDSQPVRLEVGEEFPCLVTFDFAAVDGPGQRYHGEVSFLQAPRIMTN